MGRSTTVRGALLIGWLLLVVGGSATAFAADPSGSPAPSEPGDPNTEVWQDSPLPPDIPAGRTVGITFTVWDKARQALSQVSSADVRVHPRTGKAKPTEATTRSDWPGHLTADIVIPKGGLGRIEVGFPAQVCHDDTGLCEELFLPFAFGGIGPPPDAPRSELVEAAFRPIAQPVVAGEPIDLEVSVLPRADWDRTALGLPDRLVVVARTLRGEDVSGAELRPARLDGLFTGEIIIPVAGDATLVAAFPRNGAEDDLIVRSTVRLKVTGGDAPPAAGGPAGPLGSVPADGPSIPIVPIAVGAIVLLGAGIVVRRVLADL